jgi:hypothetical protein
MKSYWIIADKFFNFKRMKFRPAGPLWRGLPSISAAPIRGRRMEPQSGFPLRHGHLHFPDGVHPWQ